MNISVHKWQLVILAVVVLKDLTPDLQAKYNKYDIYVSFPDPLAK
jgi:hypothetical protein